MINVKVHGFHICNVLFHMTHYDMEYFKSTHCYVTAVALCTSSTAISSDCWNASRWSAPLPRLPTKAKVTFLLFPPKAKVTFLLAIGPKCYAYNDWEPVGVLLHH